MAGGSPEADDEDRAAGREPGADDGARSIDFDDAEPAAPACASPRSCSSRSSARW